MFTDDFAGLDGTTEMNHMVRFYGGAFHNEVKFVDKYEDRIVVPECISNPRAISDQYYNYYAEAVQIRNHHYHRLWLTLGDGWSKPFSVFVYEGWD